MDYEAQLTAMKAVMEALKPLDDTGRKAVLNWVNSQVGVQSTATQSSTQNNALTPSARIREGTVSVVAQKLGVQSARDLLLAAATHLTLYQGKDTFTKEELVACAKDARSWKANYSNQMAFNIKRMSDAETFFEKSRDVFSLSDAALTDVEEKLSR